MPSSSSARSLHWNTDHECIFRQNERGQKGAIGVGARVVTSPLPPNRTGGFPASGSPVSGSLSERWPLWLGLRLRRLARVRRNRHLPPLIPLSRVANMRSVHTAASVHPQRGGISLPCLAFGTPGSCICSCVSFTLPPSCPPSLHGHY